MNLPKPWFWPDTQGFLAVAIITLISVIVLVLLYHPIQMDDRASGVLMTLVGVLVACLKDVYGYFFGSSKGSSAKDDTIKTAVESLPTTSPTIPRTIVGALMAILVLSLLLAPDPASAQQRVKLPIDPLGLNDRPATSKDPIENLLGALDEKLLPDLQYALKLANASGSKVTGPCYEAWIDIINTRQKAVKADDGTDMPVPNPGIVTKFEKVVELRNALQPDSAFMIKCAPVASMVKKDIVGFIGIVLSGGAGLATLVPGI